MENLNNVSELGTALPEVALAKGGGDNPSVSFADSSLCTREPLGAKPHKERWKSGWHHASAIYAKQVVSGRYKRQCCRWEQLACQRFLDDLKRQGTKDFPY